MNLFANRILLIIIVTFNRIQSSVEKWLPKILVLLIINAILLCAAHYFTFRSFWGDEAALAINIRFQTISELFSGLLSGQQFPRIYLSTIWILTTLFEYDFWILRLLPFLFGVGSVLIWPWIFWKEFKPSPSCFIPFLAIFLYLTNHLIFYYAGEFKQYSADLFWSGYAFLFVRQYVLPNTQKPLLNWTLVTLIWLLPILLSMTYVFVAFSVGCICLIPKLSGQIPQKWLKFFIAMFIAVSIITVEYFMDLQYTQGSGFRYSYWASFYINGSNLSEWFSSFWGGLQAVLGRWWVRPATIFFTILALYGLSSKLFHQLGRRTTSNLPAVGALLLLILITLAVFDRYPLEAGRAGLFFFPYAVALIVYGIQTLIQSNINIIKVFGIGCLSASLALVIFWKLPTVSYNYYNYTHWEDINSAFEALAPKNAQNVLYPDWTVSVLKTHPRLPQGFRFIYAKLTNPSVAPFEYEVDGLMEEIELFKEPQSTKATEILKQDFYFIDLYAAVTGTTKRLAKKLKTTHTYHQVVKHLYLFKRIK